MRGRVIRRLRPSGKREEEAFRPRDPTSDCLCLGPPESPTLSRLKAVSRLRECRGALSHDRLGARAIIRFLADMLGYQITPRAKISIFGSGGSSCDAVKGRQSPFRRKRAQHSEAHVFQT